MNVLKNYFLCLKKHVLHMYILYRFDFYIFIFNFFGINFDSGGVKFDELNQIQANRFQANIVKTILQIEQTFFDLAEGDKKNCLVVCDRGAMDPSACK